MITPNQTPAAHVGEDRSSSEDRRPSGRRTADEYLRALSATRRARLAILIEQRTGGNVAKFAADLGSAGSRIHQFLSPDYNHGRSIGELAARQIEERAGLPYGWLDLVENSAVEAGPDRDPRVPDMFEVQQ